MSDIISPAGNAITPGTTAVFNEANTYDISVTALLPTKALVCYRDNGNSYYGTACILSISGNTITTGTPIVFNTESTFYISVTALSDTQALVTYVDNGNGGYGTACVLDISGNTITLGKPAVFGAVITQYTSVTALSSTQALVTYVDNGNSNYGTACVLNISGNTITTGVPVVFNAKKTLYISVTALSPDKALVTYMDAGNSSYDTACVLNISGTTITIGAPVVFNTSSTGYISVTSLSTDKALVTYGNAANSHNGTACVISVSGNTITLGNPVVFNETYAFYISVTALSPDKALVTYQDADYYGTACVLDISGNTIAPGVPDVFNAASTYYTSVTSLSPNKALVSYSGNSSYGTACLFDIVGEA